jgi:hypothetical protein
LGFTHYRGKTRSGKFVVKRKTQAKRLVRKLKEIREEMRQRTHAPVREQHRWLCQMLRVVLVPWRHFQLSGAFARSRPASSSTGASTRKAKPKGSRYLGILQKLLTVFPLPEPLAQMIAPPPVLPEEPVAVTRTAGFVAAKASNGCATR